MTVSTRLACFDIEQDTPTKNGRVYTRQALDRIVQLTNERQHVFAVIDVPAEPRIKLADVAARVERVELVDGRLVGDLQLFDTPMGKRLADALTAKAALNLSPLMMGEVDEQGNVSVETLCVYGWLVQPWAAVPA